MRAGPVSAASSAYQRFAIGRAFTWTSTDAKLEAAIRRGGSCVPCAESGPAETTRVASAIRLNIGVHLDGFGGTFSPRMTPVNGATMKRHGRRLTLAALLLNGVGVSAMAQTKVFINLTLIDGT